MVFSAAAGPVRQSIQEHRDHSRISHAPVSARGARGSSGCGGSARMAFEAWSEWSPTTTRAWSPRKKRVCTRRSQRGGGKAEGDGMAGRPGPLETAHRRL